MNTLLLMGIFDPGKSEKLRNSSKCPSGQSRTLIVQISYRWATISDFFGLFRTFRIYILCLGDVAFSAFRLNIFRAKCQITQIPRTWRWLCARPNANTPKKIQNATTPNSGVCRLVSGPNIQTNDHSWRTCIRVGRVYTSRGVL